MVEKIQTDVDELILVLTIKINFPVDIAAN